MNTISSQTVASINAQSGADLSRDLTIAAKPKWPAITSELPAFLTKAKAAADPPIQPPQRKEKLPIRMTFCSFKRLMTYSVSFNLAAVKTYDVNNGLSKGFNAGRHPQNSHEHG